MTQIFLNFNLYIKISYNYYKHIFEKMDKQRDQFIMKLNNPNNWKSSFIDSNMIDYIINNAILYRLNEDAQRYFESYILKNGFSKSPPVYRPK